MNVTIATWNLNYAACWWRRFRPDAADAAIAFDADYLKFEAA